MSLPHIIVIFVFSIFETSLTNWIFFLSETEGLTNNKFTLFSITFGDVLFSISFLIGNPETTILLLSTTVYKCSIYANEPLYLSFDYILHHTLYSGMTC